MDTRVFLVLSCAAVAWGEETIAQAFTPSLLIFSDFTKRDDMQFLNFTIPFIIGKIGPNIKTNYQFINFGKNPKLICGVRNLKKSSLYQAIYLICEIHGGKRCFNKFGIFDDEYKVCVENDIEYYHHDAKAKFRRRGLRRTPALYIEKQLVNNLEPNSLLKRICAAFYRRQPPGCPGQKANNMTKNIAVSVQKLMAQYLKMRAQNLTTKNYLNKTKH